MIYSLILHQYVIDLVLLLKYHTKLASNVTLLSITLKKKLQYHVKPILAVKIIFAETLFNNQILQMLTY